MAKKHGRHPARIAVARAMLKAIDAMLKTQQRFRAMAPDSTGQRPSVMAG